MRNETPDHLQEGNDSGNRDHRRSSSGEGSGNKFQNRDFKADREGKRPRIIKKSTDTQPGSDSGKSDNNQEHRSFRPSRFSEGNRSRPYSNDRNDNRPRWNDRPERSRPSNDDVPKWDEDRANTPGWTEEAGSRPRRSNYGENRPYNRENKPFQRENRPYNRENQTGPRENRPYNRENQTGPRENRPYNRDNQSGPRENRPYNRDNQSGPRENRPYNRDNQGNQREGQGNQRENRPYSHEGRPSYGGNRDFNKDSAGQDRKPRWNAGDSENRPRFNRERTGDRPNWNKDRDPNREGFNRRSDDGKPRFPRKSQDEDFQKGWTPPTEVPEYQTEEPTEIRLNKYLANAGLSSRREADEYIKSGVVKVNDVVVTEMGFRVKVGDVVKFNDERIRAERKIYLILNKPKDYITTTDDPHAKKNVMELVENACKERIYPVGRLDRSTTGVLLFTNDGDLAGKLTHPAHKKKKIYHVFLDKPLTKNHMQEVADGIHLEDGPIQVDAISWAHESDKRQIGIEIHSGRNRIVRRIFESLGYRIHSLDRVYFAGLTKKNVPRGRWRFLTEKEVGYLKMNVFK